MSSMDEAHFAYIDFLTESEFKSEPVNLEGKPYEPLRLQAQPSTWKLPLHEQSFTTGRQLLYWLMELPKEYLDLPVRHEGCDCDGDLSGAHVDVNGSAHIYLRR